MIKYLGSKRRLVGAIGALAEGADARTALDLFTGTTRVAQAFKHRGIDVIAVDRTRCAHLLAQTYVATDGGRVDEQALEAALMALDALPGRAGYVTQQFCIEARYFRPENGERIDAIRDAIEERYQGSPLYPILLTSLIEAADRVDSTTGVQMAYLKSWAPRAHNRLALRRPMLIAGSGRALRGDAVELAGQVDHVDLAYLDPPYNQHRYESNYHVWETLVAWDQPESYGIARKRIDLRDTEGRSPFNSRRTMPDALRRCVESVDADLIVLSYNDEGWLTFDELQDLCRPRGEVEILSFDSKRYVGAQIGIHSPSGVRVGEVSHLRNTEYLVVAGDRSLVRRALAQARAEPAHVSVSS